MLRDNLTVKGMEIHFQSDGIRFNKLSVADLAGMTFSFQVSSASSANIHVFIDGKQIDVDVTSNTDSIYSIVFS